MVSAFLPYKTHFNKVSLLDNILFYYNFVKFSYSELSLSNNFSLFLLSPLELSYKLGLIFSAKVDLLPSYSEFSLNSLLYSKPYMYSNSDSYTSLNTAIEQSQGLLINGIKSPQFLKFFSTNYLKFKYDYKNGNYLSDNVVGANPFLILSKINNSNNKRFNSWFFSDSFIDFFNSVKPVSNPRTLNMATSETTLEKYSSSNMFSFFYLNIAKSDINSKFMPVNSLAQKYNKMFLSSSIQQRMYNN